MHLINKRIISIFLFCTFISNALAIDNTTQCMNNEEILFSCTMNNKKILSICSKGNNNFIFYRYGKPGEIEFSYPSLDIKADKIFSQNHYFRYRTDYFTLTFLNNEYEYTVSRYYSDDGISGDSESIVAGVKVINTESKKEFVNMCKTIEEDSISVLRDFLPCNLYGEFGCK